jgi:hypothetical protein
MVHADVYSPSTTWTASLMNPRATSSHDAPESRTTGENLIIDEADVVSRVKSKADMIVTNDC